MKMNISTRIILGFGLFFVFCVCAMVVPELLQAKSRRHRRQITNNLQMLTISAKIYAANNGGKLPDTNNWCDQLIRVVTTNKPALDPFFLEKMLKQGLCGYALNTTVAGRKIDTVSSNEILFLPVIQRGRNLFSDLKQIHTLAWDKSGALKVVSFDGNFLTLEQQKYIP